MTKAKPTNKTRLAANQSTNMQGIGDDQEPDANRICDGFMRGPTRESDLPDRSLCNSADFVQSYAAFGRNAPIFCPGPRTLMQTEGIFFIGGFRSFKTRGLRCFESPRME